VILPACWQHFFCCFADHLLASIWTLLSQVLPVPAIIVANPAEPLTFDTGRNYKLGPGTYTMSAPVNLAPGETLCITGSPSASKPTVVLPPKTAAGNSTSKLHFVLQGGSLLLTNLTVSGHMQGPHLGGGGVVIRGNSSNGKPLRSGSMLITDRVEFR
jgi:hypothetical protein